jgi:HK97 family phage portal protein
MLDTLLGFKSESGWVNKNPADDYWYTSRCVETSSGEDISESASLGIPAVYACVSKVSKTLASLPVNVVETATKDGKRTSTRVDHALGELLAGSVSTEANAMTFRQALSGNHELWGRAYAQIDWRNNGRTREPARLTLLESRYTEMKRDRDTGDIVFDYKNGSIREILPADRVWHVPGFSLNGLEGLSVIGLNREALGLAKATRQFASSFFGNGAWAGGFFTRPLEAPELSPQAGEAFIQDINEKFRGAKKAFGFGLLREAMEFKQIDMPFEDAMFMNMMKCTRVDVCGMFDVPLIMIGDGEFSTYSNTEQADIAFSKHSMLPRCKRIEMSAHERFFAGTNLKLKHNLAGLERGDYKTRIEGYAKGRQWGLYSINDIREMEDLPPVDGGNTYLEPLNMKPVGQPFPVKDMPEQQALETVVVPHNYATATIPQQGAPHPKENAPSALDIVRPMIEHAAERIASRQCKAASTAWKKHARDGRDDTFAEWADKFFVAHAEIVYGELQPILEAYHRAGGNEIIDAQAWAGVLCREWQGEVGGDPIAAEEVVKEWKCSLANTLTSHICEILKPKEDNHGHE